MSEPELKPKHRRRRPAVSCSLCRRRKIRCNRESPCSNCVRSRNKTSCVYNPSVELRPHTTAIPPPQLGVPSPSYSAASVSSIQSGSSSGPATQLRSLTLVNSLSSAHHSELETLRGRIRQLEGQLANPDQRHEQPRLFGPLDQAFETTTSELAGTFHVQHDRGLTDQPHISRSRVVHKSRVFGQSHWSHAIVQFRDIFHTMEPVLRKRPSRAASSLRRCKYLGRFIKEQQSPQWPTPLRFDTLPARDVADKLVKCYFRTIETVYRILHIPTFRNEYDKFWKSEYTDSKSERGFLVQIKLAMALGAITYDNSFSIRTFALQWIYEAEAWASEPNLKLRLNTRYIQNMLLLLLARELIGVGGDLMWMSMGSLVRTAIYMGLHRDPAHLPNRSNLDSEIHRRLWNTILEISLSSSMASGGPVLISLDDFDTLPPGNLDDEQLNPSPSITEQTKPKNNQRPLPKPEGEYTQISVALALRQAFPARLAIVKFLNDLGSRGTYEETLRLDADFRAAHKALCRTLQRCRDSSTSPTAAARHYSGPSPFASSWVNFQMHRCLAALHIPFFTPTAAARHVESAAAAAAAHAFSRNVVVETSLKIWRAVYPYSSSSSSSFPLNPHGGDPSSSSPSSSSLLLLFPRLATCGFGSICTGPLLAAMAIAAELRAQLLEESDAVSFLGPVQVRPDLLAVVHEAREWALKCIETAELNVKGFMMVCLVHAQIGWLVRGLEAGTGKGGGGKRGERDGEEEEKEEGMARCLVEAAEVAIERVLGILERKAAEVSGEGRVDGEASGGGVGGGGSGGSGKNTGEGMHLDGIMGLEDFDSSGTTPDLMVGWDFMYQMPDTLFDLGGEISGGVTMNLDPAMGWMFPEGR